MAKSKEEFEGFDRIFPLIGGKNLYQWILFGIISLQCSLPAFHSLGYIFLGASPDHWCTIKEFQNTNWTMDQIKNISIPRKLGGTEFEKCERYDLNYEEMSLEKNYDEAYRSINFDTVEKIKCTEWTYDTTIYYSTIVTEFDLVCDRHYLAATIQATFMGGAMVGSFFMGALSDGVLGRRRAVLIAIGFILIGGFGAALSPSYITFIICRFFIAMGMTASYQNCFTLLMEYTGTTYRALMGMLMGVPFALGYMLLPLYAYLIRDWANLQLALTTTCIIPLCYIWILPESSRWLISKGREEEAFEILQGIAKRNRKAELNREIVQEIFEACKNEFGDELNRGENIQIFPCHKRMTIRLKNIFKNYFRLVQTPELRKRSILLWILFTSVNFVYYGVIFDSALLTNNPYLVVFLGGLMEIPGAIVFTPLIARWGRTPTLATTFLLTGVSIIAVVFTPFDRVALRVIFSLSGKLFISATYEVIYILGTELYPTQTRATGLACASLMARVGSILAPFVVNGLKTVYADLTSVIFGITGIFAGFITLLLPETKDAELLEAVKAIEVNRSKVKSPRRESQVDIPEQCDVASV